MPDEWDFTKSPSQTKHTESIPIITYLLIFLCILFTAARYTGSGASPEAWHRLNLIASWGVPENVWKGSYWLLISTLFVHEFPLHLLFNMVWLFQLGTMLEKSMRPISYLALVLVSGVVGAGCETLWNGDLGVGFSGVIYALFGFAWMGRHKNPEWQAVAHEQNMLVMVVWAFFCWIGTHFKWMMIANGAHFGGFAFGLSLGYLVFGVRLRWLALVPLAIVVAATITAITWVPWSGAWLFIRGEQALVHGNTVKGTKYLERSMAKGYQPDPAPAVWLFIKGGREFDRHNYRGAIEAYQECIQHGFPSSAVWWNIAVCWHNLADEAYDKKQYGLRDIYLLQENSAMVQMQKAKQAGL